MTAPVDVRSESSTFLGNSSKRRQAEYLVSTGIGQDIMLPRTESVKTTHRLQRRQPRAQKKMVGISQNQSVSDHVQLIVIDCFDGAGGTHRHERRSTDLAVRQ